MTRVLQAGRREAASGTIRSVLVFVHGYGADGADLLGIADQLSPHLPDTVFLAPNAPEACAANPMGFQWFPIPWIDGASEKQAEASMRQSAEDLNAFLDSRLASEGVEPSHLALFGFSQGTMMSLHVAPRRAEPIAAIVGFSGWLLQPESLEEQAVSKPPVLLAHGDQDDLVPVQSLDQASQALSGAGFDVHTHVMSGTGHGIAPDGLGVALAFLSERLNRQP